MSAHWLKSISLTSIVLGCIVTTSQAQVIYLGGINDGFAKSFYAEADPSSEIYSGGVNDGFAVSSYVEPDPANDIYRGGINDGFALSAYIDPDPANDIFMGGVNDGFAFNSYVEADPAGDIYGGGTNDGFAKYFFSEELALPVQWKYFTIRKSNGKPILDWGADQEEQCSHYEILRSHDGKTFESIAAFECEGDPLNNEYQFEDTSPLWYPLYYYKIVQYDIDGAFTQSDVRAFNTTEPPKPEVYYKNTQLIVRSDRESSLRSVTVYDFAGRILFSQPADNSRNSLYTFDCKLTSNQLVIIQLRFDSFTHASHMRIRE